MDQKWAITKSYLSVWRAWYQNIRKTPRIKVKSEDKGQKLKIEITWTSKIKWLETNVNINLKSPKITVKKVKLEQLRRVSSWKDKVNHAKNIRPQSINENH